MNRVLVAMALACLSAAAAACGDDGDDSAEQTSRDASTEASRPDARAPRGLQIATDSLGRACEQVADCSGDGDLACLSRIPTGKDLPEGFCTAYCNVSSECGPGGACPAGDFFAAPSLASHADMLTLPQDCFQICTQTSECKHEGYVCRSLIPARLQTSVSTILGLVPSIGYNYCVPPLAEEPDASTAALVGAGLDAGL